MLPAVAKAMDNKSSQEYLPPPEIFSKHPDGHSALLKCIDGKHEWNKASQPE
jgi:hypothetical protein